MLTYGSVCSGIESASVAWEVLGLSPTWFSEVEPFPCAVLAHHWPEVPNLGDMTKLAGWMRAGALPAPDILVGGTPCQAFSVAGVRKGLGDERGQLTIHYGDLANAIDEQRGKGDECVIVWENVPGVLSDKTNAFGCFLGLLAGEDVPIVPAGKKWTNAGCVFGPQRAVAWRVIDAQYFGVAQRRRRVFVVASAREGFDPTKVLFEFEGVRRDTPPSRETRQDLGASSPPCVTPYNWTTDGVASISPTVDARAADGPRRNQGGVCVVSKCVTTRKRNDFETETFIPEGDEARMMTPTECERLQGFPDNHTRIPYRNKPAEDCPDGPRYKAIGNSKAVPCIQFVGARVIMEWYRCT